MTVWPGTITIRVLGRNATGELLYFGKVRHNYVDKNGVGPDGIYNSLKPEIIVHKWKPGDDISSGPPDLPTRIPLIRLITFRLPDSEPVVLKSPRSKRPIKQHSACLQISGTFYQKLVVSATDAATGNDVIPFSAVNNKEVCYHARPSDAIFITVESSGLKSRTLLLYGLRNRAEVYDEDSAYLGNIGHIRMNPESSPPVKESEGETFSIESARRFALDSRLISTLPLPLFRNPDVFLGLFPGYAPPPQTFGKPGPSLSPGIGTAQLSLH